MTATEIRDRVCSVVAASPFRYTQARTPFSFDLQPSGELDDVFRVESTGGSEVIGGFNLTEERTDRLEIWVAKKYAGDPDQAYRRLVTDANSIRAAVIRDGVVVSGEYCVPNGDAEFTIAREPRNEFAVLRLAVPVNYETSI